MRISLPWAMPVFIFIPPGPPPAEVKQTEPMTGDGLMSNATSYGPGVVVPGRFALEETKPGEGKRLGEQPAAEHARANAEFSRITRESKFAALDTAPKRPGRS